MPATSALLRLPLAALAMGLAVVGGGLAETAAQGEKAQQNAKLAGFRRPATVPFPADNPFTPEMANLGRALFFDPLLSRSGTISCGTCHVPALGWSDGRPRAVGEAGTPLPARSPTVIGMAWAEAFGWDGKFPSLESVAFTPITGAGNMGRNEADLLRDLGANPTYVQAFATAAPGEGVTRRVMERALATFQRTLVPERSSFDRWVDGDVSAVAENTKRGFDLFTGRAGCAECHTGWRMTDDAFHDIGTAHGTDTGRGRLFPGSVALRYAFKTPTLRDVTRRGPFMHDGSIQTLADVIDLYDRGGVARPSRDPLIRPLGLTAAERGDLLAFLQTLGTRQGDPGNPGETRSPR